MTWSPISKRRLTAWSKLRTRKGREESGQLVVEGVRAVGEAMLSGAAIEAIVGRDPDGLAAAQRLPNLGRHTLISTAQRDFSRVADTVHSSGIAAIVAWQPYAAETLSAVRPHRVLYCDGITDPGNLGTLIRTAAGLGVDLVAVGGNSVDVTNAKVVRATAGALFRVPVYHGCTPAGFASWCAERGLLIILADAGAGVDRWPTAKRWAAVIGGETSGLDPAWPADGTQRVRIRLHKGVESLNASIAGAILLDRLTRGEAKQRRVESVD